MLRLLIADDEELVRRGLSVLIQREAPEIDLVGAAVNGEDALAIVARTNPDVVLTDIRMPGVDGLQLIEALRAENPDLCFVILSGYDEFEFARRALSLGVEEYLLKPVDADELLALLQRLDAKIGARRQERERQRITLSLSREGSLKYILDGLAWDDEALVSWFEPSPAWALMLVQGRGTTTEEHQALRGACGSAVEGAIVVEDGYGYLCVLCPIADEQTASAAAVARKLHGYLKSVGAGTLVAAARPLTSLSRLGQAHGEAVEAAEYHAIGELDEPLLCWELLSRSAERWPLLPPAHTEALLAAVTTGTEEDAEREARAFMEYAREHFSPGALRAHWFELVVLLVNSVRQLGVRADALLAPRQDVHTLFSESADPSRQEAQLIGLSRSAVRECNRLRKHYSPRTTILELRDYIDNNLGGDLAITTLAERLHLNAKYLGEVFRQTTGEPLGKYIIRARMKRAGDLLATTTLKVYAVANQVGYSDSKHFATMFRSVMGATPAEYREQQYSRSAGDGERS